MKQFLIESNGPFFKPSKNVDESHFKDETLYTDKDFKSIVFDLEIEKSIIIGDEKITRLEDEKVSVKGLSLDDEEEKYFLIEWKAPTYNPEKKAVKFDFFKEDRGFEEESIAIIEQMKIGDKSVLVLDSDVVVERITKENFQFLESRPDLLVTDEEYQKEKMQGEIFKYLNSKYSHNTDGTANWSPENWRIGALNNNTDGNLGLFIVLTEDNNDFLIIRRSIDVENDCYEDVEIGKGMTDLEEIKVAITAAVNDEVISGRAKEAMDSKVEIDAQNQLTENDKNLILESLTISEIKYCSIISDEKTKLELKESLLAQLAQMQKLKEKLKNS